MNPRYILGLGLGLVLASCGGSTTSVGDSGVGPGTDSPSGSDTGSGVDTGSGGDGGSIRDTGSVTDTGSVMDTGTVTDTGTGVETGPGMEGGSGACTDAMDMTTMGMASFQMSVQTCAQNNFAAEPGTSMCIMMLGLTSACTMCIDTDLHCIINNCLQFCNPDPSTAACMMCQMMNCDPAFHMCAGI